MKAIFIDQYGDNYKLKEKELSKPELDSDEILIEIHAAGINAID